MQVDRQCELCYDVQIRMAGQVHYARFTHKQVVADDTVEFRFVPLEEFRFRPGQFISIQAGVDKNDHPILRSYSIASMADTKDLVLVVRMIPEGQGTKFFQSLSLGETIRFTGPMGFFVNELSHAGDIVYAATGTGMAPLYPMIEETLLREEQGRVFLYWGVRHETDLFQRAELLRLQKISHRLETFIYVSKPHSHYEGHRGRIIDPILTKLPHLQSPTFYLCGNGSMIQELKQALVSKGVERKRQIRTEAFFD